MSWVALLMPTPEADPRLTQRLAELRALSELVKALTSTLELPRVLRIVLERIKTLTRAEALSLLLYDGERDELVFAATETIEESAVVRPGRAVGWGLAGWVARTGQAALVADPARDPRVEAAGGGGRSAPRGLLAAPLVQSGQVVGVLELADRYGGGSFDEADLTRLAAVAIEFAATIDAGALPRDADGVRRVLAAATDAVPSEAAALTLRDAEGREVVLTRGLRAGVIDGLRIRCDVGIAGWVARHRQALRLTDVAADPRHYPDIAAATGLRPRSMLCVPMVSRDQLLGVVQVLNKLGGAPFDEEELALVETLADHAAIAIENARLYHRAWEASVTDDLTGLANTRHLNHVLPGLLARGGPVALIVLDLDRFKQVVDTHGHLIGSRTIAHIGRLIGRLLRPGDVAARFGGDEFVIALPGTHADAARDMAETIRAAIAALRTLESEEGVDLSAVTASFGVAAYPADAADATALLHAADAAMYAVKRASGNAVALARPAGTAAA
jgi:diguanylate cyclase (GGDEF)-like protein